MNDLKMVPEMVTADPDGLLGLVQLSLRQQELSGVRTILERIAHIFSSFGCIVWESSPRSHSESKSELGLFFALAQWFPDEIIWDQYDIPADSLTGFAILNKMPWCLSSDIWSDPRSHKPEFLRSHNISRMCTAPVSFPDNAIGALNVFRRRDEEPFTDDDGLLLHQIASLLPDLYGTIRDKVAYRLSQQTNLKLQIVRPDRTTLGHAERDLRKVLGELCGLLRDNLHCYDVSIFLEDPECDEEEFHLYGTTLSEPEAAGPRTIRVSGRDPTSYPLFSRRPIRIFDLRRRPYPAEGLADGSELEAADPPYVEYITQQSSRLSSHKIPLSFMCAPILAGERLLGAIRCCGPFKGSTYFAAREARLLLLLAGQIGQFISDQRTRWELMRENEAKRILLEGVSSIMDVVDAELNHPQPSEEAIIARSLETIKSVIPASDFVGIFHWDPQIREKTSPTLSAQLDRAMRSGQTTLIERSVLLKEEYSAVRKSLPFVPDQLILAPARFKEQFGFLQIAHQGPKDLPKDVTAIAGLLGRLIGLYDQLLTNILLLRRTKQELEAHSEQQKQAFMDLEHQIRAPLRHSAWRLPRVIRLAKAVETSTVPRLVKEIEYLQGIHRRAQRVAGNLRLFTNLAAGKPAEVEIQSYSVAMIRGILIAAAMDHQLYSESAGQARIFEVVRSKIDSISHEQIYLDKRLLEQALDDLLDNASKYSFDNEKVRIDAGMTKSNFVITVVNRGLRIDRSQLSTIVQRGERGALAKATVGEGSGIGLWIVDEIMKAHSGKLEIHPTNSEDFTYIRLMFPLNRGN